MKAEFAKPNRLMQDSVFAMKIAAHCEAAYTDITNSRRHITTPDEPIQKQVTEEKTAIHLTFLYTMECAAQPLAEEFSEAGLIHSCTEVFCGADKQQGADSF